MTEITRAEFDALRQKVEEIHRMLVNMGGQPNVVMVQRHITAGEMVFGSNVMPETQPLPKLGRPEESPTHTRTIPTYHEAIGAATRAFYERVKP